MIGALMGVPGKLKTLLDRLTSTWAAKLDTLHDTRITSTRAGYLDNLSAGAVAPASTALSTATWTSTRAGYLDNIQYAGKIPMASGLYAGDAVSGDGGTHTVAGLTHHSTGSTSLVDAVNISGSGVIQFVGYYHNGASSSGVIEILVDGVTVYSATISTVRGVVCPIGAFSITGAGADWNVGAFGHVPFKTSLVIRHRTVTASYTSSVYYKYWRIS